MKYISVNQAIKVVRSGGIIIFPTDTACGIGCRMDHEAAVKRLFDIRRRPVMQATPVLVDSFSMACSWWDRPSQATKLLADAYWPGGVTLIDRAYLGRIPALVRGGGNTLGCRMPDNETIVHIISGVGIPILGPSANFHGGPTPFTINDIDSELVKHVDGVVGGECTFCQASTVVDCSVVPPVIVRQGAVAVDKKYL